MGPARGPSGLRDVVDIHPPFARHYEGAGLDGGGREAGERASLTRILAHCSDMCSVDLAGHHYHGYVPRDLGIGGSDDVQLDYCLDCGQIQGKFPLPRAEMESLSGD